MGANIMETNKTIKFNDLTREFVEEFISKMSNDDKKKLKQYIEDNPKNSSTALFTMVKSYIYNYYFRAQSLPAHKKNTFADVIDSLLECDEEQVNNNEKAE